MSDLIAFDPSMCPKWHTCNAPVCPLAPRYGLSATTEKGEATCLWLREGMKAGGFDRMPKDIVARVREALPVILAEGGAYLRSKLRSAATYGSKRTRLIPAVVIA